MRAPKPEPRRWPSRNFLAELEPQLRESQAIEQLAHRSPRLRRLYLRLRRLSVPLRDRIPRREWIKYGDVRALIQATEFELAFNLGFENGIVAARAESFRSNRHDPIHRARLAENLRVALAALPLRPEAVLPTLLGLAWALVQGAPIPPRDWEASDVGGTERGSEEAVAVDVSREFSLTERESQVFAPPCAACQPKRLPVRFVSQQRRLSTIGAAFFPSWAAEHKSK